MMFKFLYYIIIAFVEYLSMKDSVFLPPSMGGKGEFTAANVFAIYDGQQQIAQQRQPPGLKVVYIVALAYHAHSLVCQLKYTHRPDFTTMMFHHVVTLALVVGSYTFNYVRIGATVMFTQDASDLVGYTDKMLADTKFKKTNIAVHLFLLPVWFYLRIYLFGKHYIRDLCMWLFGVGFNEIAIGLHIAGLCCIEFLNVYWWIMLWQIAIDALTGKKHGDPLHDDKLARFQNKKSASSPHGKEKVG